MGGGGRCLLEPLPGVLEIVHRRAGFSSACVYTLCVFACVCVRVTTINCQSTGDPPLLSSSVRIPPVLGFVFQTAIGGQEKQTGSRIPNLSVYILGVSLLRRKRALRLYFL